MSDEPPVLLLENTCCDKPRTCNAYHEVRYTILEWLAMYCYIPYARLAVYARLKVACVHVRGCHVHTVRRLHVAVLPIPPHQVGGARQNDIW